MTACKRRDHCRRVRYKAGFKSPQDGKTLSVSSVDERIYVRLTAKSFESRIHVHDNILTFRDIVGTDTNVSALRPRANVSHVVDEYSSNDDLSQHPNLYTNKLMVQAEVQVLFNTAFKEHKQAVNRSYITVNPKMSTNKYVKPTETLKSENAKK